jgi:hypothetical protein
LFEDVDVEADVLDLPGDAGAVLRDGPGGFFSGDGFEGLEEGCAAVEVDAVDVLEGLIENFVEFCREAC